MHRCWHRRQATTVLDQSDTRFRITADEAVHAIGSVHFGASDSDRRANARILGGPYEHVIKCTGPEDLEVIANVMLRLPYMLRQPNCTRCDDLRTFVLAAEGSAEVSAAC